MTYCTMGRMVINGIVLMALNSKSLRLTYLEASLMMATANRILEQQNTIKHSKMKAIKAATIPVAMSL
jgi:hypothetical protein